MIKELDWKTAIIGLIILASVWYMSWNEGGFWFILHLGSLIMLVLFIIYLFVVLWSIVKKKKRMDN